MPITFADLGKAVIETEYAVRGPIVARAAELEKQGRKIIYCNIGNPQALEQKPLTYLRQILALCEYPELVETAKAAFPPDAMETATRQLAHHFQLLCMAKFLFGCWPGSAASPSPCPSPPVNLSSRFMLILDLCLQLASFLWRQPRAPGYHDVFQPEAQASQ